MDRFYNKVNTSDPNGCHLWTACILTSGYGQFRLNGKLGRAHRVAWQLAHGPIPEGMHVLHRCDVRACVNPEHLFLGTNADNMRDMTEKGRAAKGEAGGNAKLTEADVHAIRADSRVARKIADDYGVSVSAVKHIKKRRSWKHI